MRPISGSSESPPRTRSTALRVHVGTGASLSVRSTSQASATIAAIGHHSFVSPYGMHWPLSTSACCSHSAISAQLAREPRLAEARLAGHEHEMGPLARGRGGERGAQDRDLAVAADERCLDPPVPVARRRDGPDRAPGVDGLFPSLHRDRPEGLVADAPQRRRVGRGADDHLVRPRDLLEPARGVHDVAHRGVVATGPERADQHLAGVHPDAEVHVHLELGPHLREALLHAQRGPDGPLGVVLVGDRRAEQRDQRVADHLVDLAAEGRDLDREPLEAAVDEVLDVLGVRGLRQRREPDQVGEEHGRDAPLVRPRDKAVAARRAEARVSRSRTPARRTGHGVMVGPNVPGHGRDNRPNARNSPRDGRVRSVPSTHVAPPRSSARAPRRRSGLQRDRVLVRDRRALGLRQLPLRRGCRRDRGPRPGLGAAAGAARAARGGADRPLRSRSG